MQWKQTRGLMRLELVCKFGTVLSFYSLRSDVPQDQIRIDYLLTRCMLPLKDWYYKLRSPAKASSRCFMCIVSE